MAGKKFGVIHRNTKRVYDSYLPNILEIEKKYYSNMRSIQMMKIKKLYMNTIKEKWIGTSKWLRTRESKWS